MIGRFLKGGAAFLSLFLYSQNMVLADEGSAEEKWIEGQRVYEEICSVCHGYDGDPLIPEAPNFSEGERMDKTDEELLYSITNGVGEIMPTWKADVDLHGRESVLYYLRKGIARGKVKKTED